MYVKIGNATYRRISQLSFVTEADVTGNTLPVDEFYVSIKTNNNISVGRYAFLYDDTDALWAKFWVIGSDREDDYHVRIHAVSDVAVLDYTQMPATYYSGTAIATVLNAIFANAPSGSGYALDSSLSNKTVTGFCPEQTARERLLWVLFSIQAYARQSFGSAIQIKPVSLSIEKYIMSGRIKYRPAIEFEDYVSKVTVRAYTFTLTPKASIQSTDEWVKKDDNTYYVVTHQDSSATNADFPTGLPPNEVVIDEVNLVNSGNASGILSYFKEMYFNRMSITLDAINNGDVFPGERVAVYSDLDSLAVGYVKSCNFSFGVQALATMQIVSAEEVEGQNLTLSYVVDGAVVAAKTYYLPVGYAYNIRNGYLDITSAGHRYIYRPRTEYASGTMPSAATIVQVACDTAIHQNLANGILRIWTVDSVDWASGSNEVVEIG